MSAHFRAQLKLAYAEAEELLLDDRQFPIPARNNQPDSVFLLTVRSCIQSLNDHVSDVQSIFSVLNDNSDRWMALRTNMTGAERTQDNPIYDNFVIECPFPSTVSKLRKYLRALRDQGRALEANLPAKAPNTQNAAPPSLVDLPKTTLPTFSGDCTTYITFWNTFKAGVHDTNIPSSLKFTYLKQCLSGPPLTLINSLPVFDDSYDLALALLSKHYENPEEVARALHNSLRKLPQIRTGDFFCDDLRSLLDQLECICVQMSQQNCSYDTVAVQMEVEERLPRFILDEIFMSKENDDDWSTDKLKARVWAILKRKEQIQTLHPKVPASPRHKFQTTPSPHSKFGTSHSPPEFPTLTFHSKRSQQFNNKQTNEKSNPKPKLPCLFCDNPGHFSSFCTTFTDQKARLERLKALSRCFKCLKPGHFSRQCPAPAQCSNCKGSHHRVLCFNRSENPNRSTNFSYSQPTPTFPQFSPPVPLIPPFQYHSSPPPIMTHRTSHSPSIPDNPSGITAPINQTNTAITTVHLATLPILLKCVKVRIFHPQNHKISREGIGLLDDASTHSYINFDEAKTLNLNLAPVSVRLGVFNDPKSRVIQTFSTQFGLQLMNGRSLIVSVNAIGSLTQPTSYLPFSPELLSNVDLVHKFRSTCPIILLGADFYYEVEPTPIQRLPSGYHLIHTLLGPIVAGGPNRNNFSPPIQLVNFSVQNPEQSLIPSDFFTLEGLGIRDDPHPPDTNEIVLKKFNQSIEFVDGHYQVKLPFRSDPQTLPLPSNFGLCIGRLRSVLNTLSKDPTLLNKYDKIIKEQKNSGIIELVTNPHQISPPLHYLAHHPVITHKVRIVYDGSAKIGTELSLNDCLFPGPVILPDLVGLLLRFRVPPTAITCDIEKAFLQVAVHSEHRDCARFLWLKDPHRPFSKSNMQIFRFTRVSFGLTSSPFLLAATIRHHLPKFPSELSQEVALNTYVDNILLSVQTPNEGQIKTNSIISLFQRAGMTLREFASNSENALSKLPDDLKLSGSEQKFLGLKWNTKNDSLEFNLSPPSNNFIPSKRSILSFIASQYDPLGLISPLILPLKIFLQSVFQSGSDWDQTLPIEIQNDWDCAIKNWQIAEKVSIPRCPVTLPLEGRKYQLHCFTDASSLAMCATVYLRITHPSFSQAEVFLIFSKTKVKPTHKGTPLTIPRLELIAVEIGTRALKFTQSQFSSLNLDPELNIWSDSSIVPSWLNSAQNSLEIFVQNRVKSIKSTPNLVVRHLPGSENPADIGTRGLNSAQILSNSSVWWSGPKWLPLLPINWPDNRQIKHFRSSKSESSSILATPLYTFATEQLPDKRLIDLSHFSRLPKAFRITALAFRFIKCVQKRQNPKPNSVPISFIEFKKSFKFLIAQEQAHYPPSDQDTENLGLYTDTEKIIRAKGRLGKSQLPASVINPIFLPPKSHLTHLIARVIGFKPQFLFTSFRHFRFFLNNKSKFLITPVVILHRFWQFRWYFSVLLLRLKI